MLEAYTKSLFIYVSLSYSLYSCFIIFVYQRMQSINYLHHRLCIDIQKCILMHTTHFAYKNRL